MKLFSFEGYVVKISAFKVHQTRKLLTSEHGTLIMGHPVFDPLTHPYEQREKCLSGYTKLKSAD